MTDNIYPETREYRIQARSLCSEGSIKEMGLLQKIIDKIFFCMGRNSRIGLFLSIEVTITVIGLVSLLSTVIVLIKIGQAVILLLLKE